MESFKLSFLSTIIGCYFNKQCLSVISARFDFSVKGWFISVAASTTTIPFDMSEKKAGWTVAIRALTKQMNFIRQCIAENKFDNLKEQITKLKVYLKMFCISILLTMNHLQKMMKSMRVRTIMIEQERYIKVLEQAKDAFLASWINEGRKCRWEWECTRVDNLKKIFIEYA